MWTVLENNYKQLKQPQYFLGNILPHSLGRERNMSVLLTHSPGPDFTANCKNQVHIKQKASFQETLSKFTWDTEEVYKKHIANLQSTMSSLHEKMIKFTVSNLQQGTMIKFTVSKLQKTMIKFTGSNEQVYRKQWASLQETMSKFTGSNEPVNRKQWVSLQETISKFTGYNGQVSIKKMIKFTWNNEHIYS